MRNARKLSRSDRALRAWMAVLLAGLLGGFVAGCDEDCLFCSDCESPNAPVDVYSVTGDGEVWLYWTPIDADQVDEFVVYRSAHADGPYTEIAHTRRDMFVDRDVRNGHTYFYAVTAIDVCGYESDLSRELVHDTPRPEGFGAYLDDANGDVSARSGWDFSGYRALVWDHDETDVYFLISDGVPFLVAADMATDIQDAGYIDFDGVDWAPERGWSPSGAVELIPGHMIVVWTRDNHFAKVRVESIGAGRLTFDWAYQIDTGNRELAPRPSDELRLQAASGLRPAPQAM